MVLYGLYTWRTCYTGEADESEIRGHAVNIRQDKRHVVDARHDTC
jgi:hypothetical protein